MANIKMQIITDSNGKIVAAAPESKLSKSDLNVTISPMTGQTLHLIEVPVEFMNIKSGHDFHVAISNLMVNPKSIEVRKKKKS